jgi:hypothetical protein
LPIISLFLYTSQILPSRSQGNIPSTHKNLSFFL